ncbi:universal stress protein [Streptomyces sp. cg36]|uniref:universal stress protein n=1 Tax=Streptomyces sp. cg36 TaxID=3238798 RepID=UPI0034E29035
MDAQITRVVIGVDTGPGSLTALRHAWAEAQRHGAVLHVIHAFGGSDPQQYGPACIGAPDLHAEQRRRAREELRKICVDALGRTPAELPITIMVVRGRPGAVLTRYADRPTDLLLVGAGSARLLKRLFTSSVTAYCFRHAQCPVLSVPAPALVREYGKGARRWNGWVRRQADEAAREALLHGASHT